MTNQERYAQLREETTGNVTVLSGPAGCGKTRRAEQMAKGRAACLTSACELTLDGENIRAAAVDAKAAKNAVLVVDDCRWGQLDALKKIAKTWPSCSFILIQDA